MDDSCKEAEQVAASTKLLVIALTLAATLAGMLVGFVVTRSITEPMAEAVQWRAASPVAT